jgi:xanthine dehydrogenase YagR molybdenum-binding subunit
VTALIGAPRDRADGRAKITGTARYSAENDFPGLVYAALVLSDIPAGRVHAIETAQAAKLPGVLKIYTHENAPRAKQQKKEGEVIWRNLALLQDDEVRYDRQPVALVVADTYERAIDAASRVRVTYAKTDAATDFAKADTYIPPETNKGPEVKERGTADAAFASAPVKIDRIYTTPQEHHNPMEPHATVALWKGADLTVYDATQGVFPTRARLAYTFDLPVEQVHVISPYIGGGFGCKGSVWPHTALAAMAARDLGRPVKLTLERPQMFGSVGYRPLTHQRLALGADATGKLISTIHEVKSNTSIFDLFVEPSTAITRMLYAVPNLRYKQEVVRLNFGTPTFMRAPGESSGSFALESAMDELAYEVGVDPLALRLLNYAETDPDEGTPYSSKSLRECYRVAAERFGWSKRSAAPRSMQEGRELIGWGMATSSYPTNRSMAAAYVRIAADGSVIAATGTQELGTGSYTVYAQVAAEALGISPDRVRFELGDTTLPQGPVSGGSQTAASVSPAVRAAALDARDRVLAFASADPKSPLFGATPGGVTVTDGRFALTSDPSKGATYAEILARHPAAAVEGRANTKPDEDIKKQYAMHAFGAQFAEVRVDADTGMIRVTRMVGAFASGRILNEKLAHSQYIGGMTWAIGMALHEATRTDLRSGRVMNANLSEYLVPVNADVPALEAILIPEEDPYVNPLGVKGIGEIGIVGGAAAIANAVFHATGKRIRDLPIGPDTLN